MSFYVYWYNLSVFRRPLLLWPVIYGIIIHGQFRNVFGVFREICLNETFLFLWVRIKPVLNTTKMYINKKTRTIMYEADCLFNDIISFPKPNLYVTMHCIFNHIQGSLLNGS